MNTAETITVSDTCPDCHGQGHFVRKIDLDGFTLGGVFSAGPCGTCRGYGQVAPCNECGDELPISRDLGGEEYRCADGLLRCEFCWDRWMRL